ncbi:MAG TPA: tetratricopeptide repeat protein [Candidatus Baltobacteraceae bacterium]|jgi:tetratricopeptide (TPR) repeat protein
MEKDGLALNDRAVELFRNGRAEEARALLEAFLSEHPQSVVARVNLGYMLFAARDFDGALEAYGRAADSYPGSVQAYHGLSSVYDALGDEERSRWAFDRACRLEPIRKRPYRGTGSPKNVLLLCSAYIANLNAYALLDARAFAITTAFVEYADPQALRGHDVVFNAISEPERAGDALDRAQSLIASLGIPAVNAPAAVRASTRENNALRLAGIDGAVVPRVRRIPKSALVAGDVPSGTAYPAIVRAIGHHDGRHMERVDTAEELLARVAQLPGEEVHLIGYVDVRSEDGNVRKYRMTIAGSELYPLHLAVSRRWKVHYVTSDMEDSPENRAEDERFLRDPAAVVGGRAMSALHAVRERLKLDYGGIDFGLDRDGNAVIFEANASMFVPPAGNDAKWSYRREPTARIVDAVTRFMVSASSTRAASD